ncbi:MAG: ABC transporter ATP-binding protein [Alphaproteobacteria bacterium]|nr:ABC transporter ATP-binding protein [Alphaproteobacteria bacterium]
MANLSAGYLGRDVLHELSLSVPAEGLTAIIGPNGHGKTTLLRAISGLVPRCSGAITLDGRPLQGLRPDARVAAGVVHVPQGDMVFAEMTVLDNLLMGAYLPAAARSAKERLEEVFALLPKLAERRGQIASTLSGGERRMLGIGRGLMADGRVILLDEPSLGLAPIVIEQIYALIAQLKNSGRTLLVVEENAARVVELAEAIHLLDDGRFVWSGAGAELMARPEILETYFGG